MRGFDSCSLCLQRARDPVACSRGHLYCKECIYSDLLSQRKEIKRYQAKLDALAREEEEERDNAKNRARERVVADFEKNQLGLGAKKKEVSVIEGSTKSDSSEGAYARSSLYIMVGTVLHEQPSSLSAQRRQAKVPHIRPRYCGQTR